MSNFVNENKIVRGVVMTTWISKLSQLKMIQN